MTWTTTFDASHKVKVGGHAAQFSRHIGRDADEDAGFAFGHSNKGIDPARTRLNRTMVNDGAGGYRRPEITTTEDGVRPPSAELSDYLESRLATVEKKLRKDAVVARPFVFKADPKWYDEHCPNWRTEGLNDEALALHEEATRFVEQWGGQHNVVGYSDHVDEAGHPERQIFFTPVTDDGRLSQKDFFPNPAAMKRMHKEVREHLRKTCGYDAAMSVAPRSREHLSSAEFGDRADKLKLDRSRLKGEQIELTEEREQFENERDDELRDRDRFEHRRAVLEQKWGRYNEASARLDKRAEALAQRETGVAERERGLDNREVGLVGRERAVSAAQGEVEERSKVLDERERSVAGAESGLARSQVAIRDERERLRREAAELESDRREVGRRLAEIPPFDPEQARRDMQARLHDQLRRMPAYDIDPATGKHLVGEDGQRVKTSVLDVAMKKIAVRDSWDRLKRSGESPKSETVGQRQERVSSIIERTRSDLASANNQNLDRKRSRDYGMGM